jgi:hypothetical protein
MAKSLPDSKKKKKKVGMRELHQLSMYSLVPDNGKKWASTV